MHVNAENVDRIVEALEKQQGKSRVRLMDYTLLMDRIAYIERHLESIGVPKYLWRYIKATIGTNEVLGKTCNGEASATYVSISRGARGWFVDRVFRGRNHSVVTQIDIDGLQHPDITDVIIRSNSHL